MKSLVFLLAFVVGLGVCAAGPASVEHVELLRRPRGWKARVRIHHDDHNWRHYANWIEVRLDEHRRLVRSEIGRPFVDEDRPPFHRVYLDELPPGTRFLIFRAHCRVHSFDGDEVVVDLASLEGEGYTVGTERFDVHRRQYFRGEGDFMRTWLRRYLPDADQGLLEPYVEPPRRGRPLVNPQPSADGGLSTNR